MFVIPAWTALVKSLLLSLRLKYFHEQNLKITLPGFRDYL